MASPDPHPNQGHHAPRTATGAPPPASLELFYDLVFVATVVVLSHSYSVSPTASDLVWLILVFAVTWLIWLQTSLLFNVTRADRHAPRFLVLAQMLLLVLATVSAADGLLEHNELVGPILGVILLVVSLMQWEAERADPQLRSYTRPRIVGNMVATVLLLTTPLWGDVGYVAAWSVVLVAMVVPSLRPDPLGGARRDAEHLVERFGAFTIIMLGESFVKTALTATEARMEGLDLICMVGTFVIVFAIWWLYFADVPVAGPPSSHYGHQSWLLLHLPLHLCIVGIAVGTARLVIAEAPEEGPAAVPYLAIPLVGVLVSLAALSVLSGDRATSSRAQRTFVASVHLVGAAAVGVIGLVIALVEPSGIETTSVLLATVMILVVVVTTSRLRRTAGPPAPDAVSA